MVSRSQRTGRVVPVLLGQTDGFEEINFKLFLAGHHSILQMWPHLGTIINTRIMMDSKVFITKIQFDSRDVCSRLSKAQMDSANIENWNGSRESWKGLYLQSTNNFLSFLNSWASLFGNFFNQISDHQPSIIHNTKVKNAADWPLIPFLPSLTIQDIRNPKFQFK